MNLSPNIVQMGPWLLRLSQKSTAAYITLVKKK